MLRKISTRFFDDIPVKAIWDDETSKWWFCASDVCEALSKSKNPRSYWNAIKRRNTQLSTNCRQLKLTAEDGKRYLTDVVDEDEVNKIITIIPNKKSRIFDRWFKQLDTSLDEKSKIKAYEFFETGLIEQIEVGTIKGLQQIHGYIFGGLYDFVGKIRSKNIAKDGFSFTPFLFLKDSLKKIENMPEDSIEAIVHKYVEMNVAHPFMEGNGRSTRIWLDLILKKNLQKCVDWSKVNKYEYLKAMKESPFDESHIFSLIINALTDDIKNRDLFLKGVDYSYYYEQNDE